MTRSETFSIVVESICEETSLADPSQIVDATRASDVAGWDSLAHVRIVLGIEMELDITLPNDETYEAESVGELVDLVCRVSEGKYAKQA